MVIFLLKSSEVKTSKLKTYTKGMCGLAEQLRTHKRKVVSSSNITYMDKF